MRSTRDSTRRHFVFWWFVLSLSSAIIGAFLLTMKDFGNRLIKVSVAQMVPNRYSNGSAGGESFIYPDLH